jgi:SAM-dependent methyltransferase
VARTAPFDNYYELYEKWFEDNRFVYLSELKAVKHFIPSGKKGIEIGSGSGMFALPLGIKIGIEPSSKMRELAVSRGMNVINGVAENLSAVNETFDFALMVTTVCFLDDVEKSFQEVHRILKPGGFFIIGFVDKDSPLGKVYSKKKSKSKFYTEATFYSALEVINRLKKTNFFGIEVIQTIFGNSLEDTGSVQDWKYGFGEGSFVVMKATPKEPSHVF